MSVRHIGYVVVLEAPTREEDAAATLAAIRQLRSVADVQPVESVGASEFIVATRERLAAVEIMRDALARILRGAA